MEFIPDNAVVANAPELQNESESEIEWLLLEDFTANCHHVADECHCYSGKSLEKRSSHLFHRHERPRPSRSQPLNYVRQERLMLIRQEPEHVPVPRNEDLLHINTRFWLHALTFWWSSILIAVMWKWSLSKDDDSVLWLAKWILLVGYLYIYETRTIFRPITVNGIFTRPAQDALMMFMCMLRMETTIVLIPVMPLIESNKEVAIFNYALYIIDVTVLLVRICRMYPNDDFMNICIFEIVAVMGPAFYLAAPFLLINLISWATSINTFFWILLHTLAAMSSAIVIFGMLTYPHILISRSQQPVGYFYMSLVSLIQTLLLLFQLTILQCLSFLCGIWEDYYANQLSLPYPISWNLKYISAIVVLCRFRNLSKILASMMNAMNAHNNDNEQLDLIDILNGAINELMQGF